MQQAQLFHVIVNIISKLLGDNQNYHIKEDEMSWKRITYGRGEERNASMVLLRKPEGKNPLGKPRHGQEGNIKTNVREIYLTQDGD